MIILTLISLNHIKNTISKSPSASLTNNLLTCDNLQVFFDSNITFFCQNQFNYSTRYDKLLDITINVKNSVNFINNSFKYDQISLSMIREIIKLKNGIGLTFTEFLDMFTIHNFIYLFQSTSSYDNVLLTMDWSKYITGDSNYCQWDYSTILPHYSEIMKQFEKFGESSVWEKVCLNNQACFHYVSDPPGQIIFISKKVTIILIVLICLVILLILLLLYSIARCKVFKKKSPSRSKSKKDENSENSLSSSNSDENSESVSKSDFHINFFRELLGIGHSAGSLIIEGIGIMRLFQRLSSTETFKLHFSKDCYKMISWAKELFEIILSNFYTRPFTDLELFYFYNYVFPTIIITFITMIILTNRYYYLLIINVIFVLLGFGLGIIEHDYMTALCFIIPTFCGCIVTIIAFIALRLDKKFFSYIHSMRFVFPFSFSVINTLILASIILTPFYINNLYFLGSCLFVCLIIIIVAVVIELCIGFYKHFDKMSEYFMFKFPVLASNVLSLLYLPTVNHFVNLMSNGEYKRNWNCIVGFINFGILLPLVLILLMMFSTNVTEKYRKRKLVFYEIVDMIRQLIYAFVSAYDVVYACIAVEVVWMIVIISHHPYCVASEYVLQIGNSLILLISNIVIVVYKAIIKDVLSFYASLGIVIAACLPAILSLFVFFGKDFEIVDEKLKEEKIEKRKKLSTIIGVLTSLYNPFSWLIFGMVCPVIMQYFNNYYSNFHKM